LDRELDHLGADALVVAGVDGRCLGVLVSRAGLAVPEELGSMEGTGRDVRAIPLT
jgi:hypothetical protein